MYRRKACIGMSQWTERKDLAEQGRMPGLVNVETPRLFRTGRVSRGPETNEWSGGMPVSKECPPPGTLKDYTSDSWVHGMKFSVV